MASNFKHVTDADEVNVLDAFTHAAAPCANGACSYEVSKYFRIENTPQRLKAMTSAASWV